MGSYSDGPLYGKSPLVKALVTWFGLVERPTRAVSRGRCVVVAAALISYIRGLAVAYAATLSPLCTPDGIGTVSSEYCNTV